MKIIRLCLCSLMCVLSLDHVQNFPLPSALFLELRSHANLPCLVNLALNGLAIGSICSGLFLLVQNKHLQILKKIEVYFLFEKRKNVLTLSVQPNLNFNVKTDVLRNQNTYKSKSCIEYICNIYIYIYIYTVYSRGIMDYTGCDTGICPWLFFCPKLALRMDHSNKAYLKLSI